ncbi:MAG: DUF4340 domain-containing protein [Reichenbachiella sp.]
MSKIQKLSIFLGVLICVSIGLHLFSGREATQSFDKSLFMAGDTSLIQSINIEFKGQEVEISRTSDGWKIDGDKRVDPSLIDVFNAIVSQVTVLRPVSPLNFEEIKEDLVSKGRKVTIETVSGSSTFYVGGNSQKTQSYFATKDLTDIYLVGIPGYNHYLSGVFELNKGQWRSRTLFNSNWRTMQSLELRYLGAPDDLLSIKFDGTFFAVNGVLTADSLSTVNYINQFENFQLNDYLEAGVYPTYDSLKQTAPFAELVIQDIDSDYNKSFVIYPKMKGEQFYLFVSKAGEMIVLDEKRVKNILKKPYDFHVD